MREEILRMEHICCTDEGVLELDYLNMQIFKGEIYGVLELENHGICVVCCDIVLIHHSKKFLI